MPYSRVRKIITETYNSNEFIRTRAWTYDSRGHRTGGCDIMGDSAAAVKECLTLKERERMESIEVIVK